MIKLLKPLFPIGKCYSKLLLIMKLNVLFLVLCTFQISAISYSQDAKVNLKMEEATLADIFNEIEAQSEYRIFYRVNDLDLSKHYTVKFNNCKAKDVLDQVLDGSGSTFKCIDKIIVISSSLKDQEIVVKGKIIDVDGIPLPGVNVVEKGTTNGTITDYNGEYTISISSPDAILSFSYVGYLTEEIEVAGNTKIDITMVEDIQSLEEVVVIGYGTVKKADLTGAVSSVKSDDITSRQATQISQALQGSMSGVMVTRDNSAPGASSTIRIRGVTTLGDNNPLIILDGVPVDNINDINPNDVESISVLKDAASASIYGSRAAAGVILVTTKRAAKGELSINYNFEYGIEKPTELASYVDAVRYMQMANELKWNDNGNLEGGEFPTYAEDVINNYATLHAENPDLYPDTDWVDLILKNNAPRETHVLSITGGTESIRSKASIAYDNVGGLYMGKNYKRLTARINNDIEINKYLSAKLDFYAKRSISENPSENPMYTMRISAPVYAAEWSNGLVAEGKSGGNIYGQIKYGGYKDYWYNQVGGKAALDFKPFEGFTLSAIISPDFKYDKGKEFLKKVEYTDYDDPSTYVGTLQWAKTTSLKDIRNDSYRVTAQLIANYSKSFAGHNLNLMGGYENYKAFYETMNSSSEQLELTTYPYLDLANENYLGSEGNAYENAYRSYFGRIMYNYANKYFVQGNIRYDASSRFDQDYRWGSFPSFSAGWIVSEEDFMSDVPVLSFLKLRGSWGVLGNERILDQYGDANYYPYQSTMAFGSALFYNGSTVVSSQSAAQQYYAIRDISWETTESFDFGLDANFFENRLRFTGDVYKKTTNDMLLELEIPDYLGFDNPQQNTGKMNTKGWEASLGWNDRIGEFSYSVSVNISDSKSVMGELGGIVFDEDGKATYKDSEFEEWYGYVSDGIYQTQEEVENSATLSSTVTVGDVKYVDISGPDGVPDGIISADYDRVLLGGSLPRYIYGGNIHLEYKNFDFSVVVQGVGKQNSQLTQRMVRGYSDNWGNFPGLIDGKYWSAYNTDEQNASAIYPRLSYVSAGNNYTTSDYWLFNGAYFRVKNLTIGYTIPEILLNKLRLQGVRIYGSMSDFLSINNYPEGWDPEVSSDGYPITASFVFGASVKF